jgi:hypothetical protein
MNSKFKITHLILGYGNKRQKKCPKLAQNLNPKEMFVGVLQTTRKTEI